MQEELRDWVGGAFVHNHFRVDDLVHRDGVLAEDPELTEFMMRYTDGSFSLEAITFYLGEIMGEPILITDTQHPSYVLSPEYDDLEDTDKIQFFNPVAIESTIDLMSKCALARAELIRRFYGEQHVLTGIEVDILSARGKLSVNDGSLSRLDYVTASLHSSLWYASGSPQITINNSIEAYNYTVENPYVNTLSHPTFYVPLDARKQMSKSDWVELFQNMALQNVAFEVNLDSSKLLFNHDGNLDGELVALALREGVPIVIGFDFHYMGDWGGYPSPDTLLTLTDAKRMFARHVNNGSISRLLARVMGNIYALKQIGVTPANIINSHSSKFNVWLDRKEL